MGESRRKFLLQSIQRVSLSAGGLALFSPPNMLAATLQRYHVVRKNENLTLIARRYGVTVKSLLLWNGLTSDVILPGQKIVLK